jgi:hypothetical protein
VLPLTRAAARMAAYDELPRTGLPDLFRTKAGPATPPVRAKGAPVWLDLDQQDLDDAYDQSVYAFNSRNIAERHAADNQRALSVTPGLFA